MLKKLVEENDALKEQLMVFDTLARHFENVYWIDLEKRTARILKLDASYVDVPGKEDHKEFLFEAVVKHWIDTIVYEEDRDKVRSVITAENVLKNFETKDEVVGNYRSVGNGEVHYFQYTVSKASKDKRFAILGFQNVDDIIKEHEEIDAKKREQELLHQKEVDEQLSIIKALSKSFRNVFVANMTEGTARAIRLANNYNVKAIRDVSKITFHFDEVIDRWVNENVHPDDKKKVKESLNVENIRRVFSKYDKYVGTYRNIEDGVMHYYQYDCRRIDNTENVVVGFQLIDKIVEEQKEAQRREMALREARIKEEKERVEVINSLSTIYSTIFQANLKTHEYEELTSVPLMEKVIENKGNFDTIKEVVLDAFVEDEYRTLVSDFLNLDTLSERLEKINTVVIDYKAPNNRWMQARFIVKRRDSLGKVVEVLYVARNITEEKLTKYQAEHDALTGILNRGSFDQIIKSMEFDKKNFALILMDIDRFKDVNDTYGHQVGDVILKKVSKYLQEGFRSIDHVCRIGGDEFAVVMMDVDFDSKHLIEEKMSKINELLNIKEESIPQVSLSVGVAFTDWNNPGTNLFNNADFALYYVKRHGRNGCHFYTGKETIKK